MREHEAFFLNPKRFETFRLRFQVTLNKESEKQPHVISKSFEPPWKPLEALCYVTSLVGSAKHTRLGKVNVKKF